MLVNEYKPEFYDRKVRKMRDLGNVYICESPFVMSRTDAQNGLYSIFKFQRIVQKAKVLCLPKKKNISCARFYFECVGSNYM